MTQLNSLQSFRFYFEYLPGDDPRVIGQRTRRKKEADVKKLQNKAMKNL